MIQLRINEGLKIGFTIQVDTLCHRIPNFIEKAAQAGVRRVFIGWIRRRLRSYLWRQWQNGHNRFSELRRRGVPKFHAAVAAGSPTGFWRMSGHPAVQQALRNPEHQSRQSTGCEEAPEQDHRIPRDATEVA